MFGRNENHTESIATPADIRPLSAEEQLVVDSLQAALRQRYEGGSEPLPLQMDPDALLAAFDNAPANSPYQQQIAKLILLSGAYPAEIAEKVKVPLRRMGNNPEWYDLSACEQDGNWNGPNFPDLKIGREEL